MLGHVALILADVHVEKLGRGIAWLDTGTHESFVQATNFIQIIDDGPGHEGIDAADLGHQRSSSGTREACGLECVTSPARACCAR